MQIRPLTTDDLGLVPEIDATLESDRYLHLHKDGEGLEITWRLELRDLKRPIAEGNLPDDLLRLRYKQVAAGMLEGAAYAADLDGEPVGATLVLDDPESQTSRLEDVRVDSDYRRQGLASMMLFQVIGRAREMEHRAVQATTLANRHPANALLHKLGFELAGVDEARASNHDVVKERATLLWTLPLT